MAVDGDESGLIRITVGPADNFYTKGSSAWNAELAELRNEVERDLGSSIQPAPPGRDKGDPVTILVLLVSSGAVTALFNCARTWIEKHPGRRKLNLTWDDGQSERSLQLDASNMNDQSLTAAIEGAMKRGD